MKLMTEAYTKKARTGWKRRMWWEEPEGEDYLLSCIEDLETRGANCLEIIGSFIVSSTCEESCQSSGLYCDNEIKLRTDPGLNIKAECKCVIYVMGLILF